MHPDLKQRPGPLLRPRPMVVNEAPLTQKAVITGASTDPRARHSAHTMTTINEDRRTRHGEGRGRRRGRGRLWSVHSPSMVDGPQAHTATPYWAAQPGAGFVASSACYPMDCPSRSLAHALAGWRGAGGGQGADIGRAAWWWEWAWTNPGGHGVAVCPRWHASQHRSTHTTRSHCLRFMQRWHFKAFVAPADSLRRRWPLRIDLCRAVATTRAPRYVILTYNRTGIIKVGCWALGPQVSPASTPAQSASVDGWRCSPVHEYRGRVQR